MNSLTNTGSIELSIVMPCLNEARTLSTCIEKAKCFLIKHNVQGEIIIADNNSTDQSQAIALSQNVTLVVITKRGYGATLKGGIKQARGKYIIVGDSDDSYCFESLMPFLSELRKGYDFVIGNRFSGHICAGAMPLLHRYIGNPILSFIGRLLFKSTIGDFHCGLRGFQKHAFEMLQLESTGFEFASEMIIKATQTDFLITEIPINFSADGRNRPSHLNTWADGWKNLLLMLRLRFLTPDRT